MSKSSNKEDAVFHRSTHKVKCFAAAEADVDLLMGLLGRRSVKRGRAYSFHTLAFNPVL